MGAVLLGKCIVGIGHAYRGLTLLMMESCVARCVLQVLQPNMRSELR